MRNHFLLITISLLYAMGTSQPSRAETFDRKAWLDSYQSLKKQLEHSYANLTWFASPESGVNLPELDRLTLATLNAAASDAAAEGAIETFIHGFHDGHLSRLPWLDPDPKAMKAKIDPPQRSATASEACAALGYVRKRGVAFSLPFEAAPGFRLLADGERQSFRSGIVKIHDQTIAVIRIPEFTAKEFPPECLGAWKKIRRARGVCDKACAEALEGQATDRLLATLAERLRSFKRLGASAVLVDLGGNPGGSELGDWITRLFTAAPVRSPRLGIVHNRLATAYYDEQLTDIRDALQSEKAALARAKLIEAEKEYSRLKELTQQPPACDMSWVWKEQRPWGPVTSECTNLTFGKMYFSGYVDYMAQGSLGSPKAEEKIYWPVAAAPYIGSWTGPVSVLIDGRTASAAEVAAAVFRDNGIAKLIGSKTTGAGCGFMFEGSEIRLPHPKLKFRVPNCVRLRSDGTDEARGISPDIPLAAYEGETSGERAIRVLDAIGK